MAVKDLKLLFILISIILLYTIIIYKSSFADSPSFIRQEIGDNDNDWGYDSCGNISNFTGGRSSLAAQHYPAIDLKAISYVSDGKTINASLWPDSGFRNKNPRFTDVSSINAGIYLVELTSGHVNIEEYIKKMSDFYNKTFPYSFDSEKSIINGSQVYRITYYNDSMADGISDHIEENWMIQGNKSYLLRFKEPIPVFNKNMSTEDITIEIDGQGSTSQVDLQNIKNILTA